MTIDDGGPAFPRPSSPGDGSYSSNPQDGMTLRDYFAAQALTGMLASYTGDDSTFPQPSEAANAAYSFADAMLAARRSA